MLRCVAEGLSRCGLQVLENLDHRGARGCEKETGDGFTFHSNPNSHATLLALCCFQLCFEDTGDGAGILCGIPDRFMRRVASELSVELPPPRE